MVCILLGIINCVHTKAYAEMHVGVIVCGCVFQHALVCILYCIVLRPTTESPWPWSGSW